jgi:hypothetical protein
MDDAHTHITRTQYGLLWRTEVRTHTHSLSLSLSLSCALVEVYAQFNARIAIVVESKLSQQNQSHSIQ